MSQDMAVQCYLKGGQHEQYVLPARVFIALYAFGIPFLGYLVLRRNIKDMTYVEMSPCIVHEFDEHHEDGLKLLDEASARSISPRELKTQGATF